MLPVRRKRQRPRIVSARRQVHQVLRFAKPLGGLGIVPKGHPLVRVPDVNIVSMDRDAERPPLAADKGLAYLCSAGVLRIAHHNDFSRTIVSQKNISIRRYRQPSGMLEVRRKYIHAKSLGHARQEPRRRFRSFLSLATSF